MGGPIDKVTPILLISPIFFNRRVEIPEGTLRPVKTPTEKCEETYVRNYRSRWQTTPRYRR